MIASKDASEQLKSYGIALTGGIGTGKSTVAKLLRQRGFTVIDADILARAVTAPGTPGLTAIAHHFGAAAITPEGTLNRSYLAQHAFQSLAAKQALEAITHPLIRAALLEAVLALDLAAAPRPFFYEAALIFETKSQAAYRAVWATYCPSVVQKERLMQRDGITSGRADLLIANQMDAQAKAELADAVIDTSGPIADVKAQVDRLLQTVASPP